MALSIVGLASAALLRPGALIEATRPSRAAAPASGDARFLLSVEPPEAGTCRVSLVPIDLAGSPDLFAYVVEGEAAGDGVPTGARLVGPVHPTRTTTFDLPEGDVSSGASSLLVYSLGHGERVDAEPLLLPEVR